MECFWDFKELVGKLTRGPTHGPVDQKKITRQKNCRGEDKLFHKLSIGKNDKNNGTPFSYLHLGSSSGPKAFIMAGVMW